MSKLKFPEPYTIILILIIMAGAATWIVPAGHYQYYGPDGEAVSHTEKEPGAYPIAGTYQPDADSHGQGLMGILKGPIQGFYDGKAVIILTLALGGIVNVIMATGALTNGILLLMRKFRGREILIIPILTIIFSMGGTTSGSAEETVAYYPILIPLMVACGYDALTAVAIIYGGSQVGVLASTINPYATGVASSAAGVSLADGLLLRSLMLVVLTAITIAYIMRYASRVKMDHRNSITADTFEIDRKYFLKNTPDKALDEVVMSKRQWYSLGIFAGSFVLMAYAIIPFSNFGIHFIPTLNWWFDEITVTFISGSLLIGLVMRWSEKEMVRHFMAGVQNIMSVAVLIGMARGVKLVLDAGHITDTLLFWSEEFVSNLSSYVFISGVYVVEFIMSICIISTSGLAAFSIPILAPLATFADVDVNLVINAYQLGHGTVMLGLPTSPILLIALAMARTTYARWLKFITPLLAVLIIATLGMMFIAAAI